MNKKDYQEALTNLKTYIVDYDDEFGADIYLYESYKEEFDLLQELIDKYEELEEEHNKLKDKEKSKKVKPFLNSFYIKICPNCGLTLETKRNYCDNCGQKLDWSDD